MTTRKTSVLRTFFEYLGRGASPVDGIYWVANTRASDASGTPRADARRLNVTSSASSQPRGKSAPAAPGR